MFEGRNGVFLRQIMTAMAMMMRGLEVVMGSGRMMRRRCKMVFNRWMLGCGHNGLLGFGLGPGRRPGMC